MADDNAGALSAADYDAIAEAVMETSRGRWFLAEFARRNRHADTQVLLDALQRIEGAVERIGSAPPIPVAAAEGDLSDMAEALARTRQEIARSIGKARGGAEPDPNQALEAMVAVAERAAADSFGAAERVQEAVWTLRERGDVDGLAGDLDRDALDIYRTSTDQSLTVDRIKSLITVLHGIEARINNLLGRPLAITSPEREAGGEPVERVMVDSVPLSPLVNDPVRVSDIDFVPLRSDAERRAAIRPAILPALPPVEVSTPPRPAREPSPRALPFRGIDMLEPEEKLALFV
jgi:hypothetical protein